MNSLSGFIEIFAWFFILIGLGFLLGFLWGKIFPGKIRRLIVFPGVIIHEISHALGCILTLAKIKEIKFFSAKGSYVSHSKSKIPLIGKFVISFSPIAGGIAFLFLFSLIFDFDFPKMNLLNQSFYQNFLNFFKESISFIFENYKFWQFWVFIYLTISTVICLVPSKKDFKNSFFSTVFLIIILILLIHLGFFSEQIVGFLKKPIAGILGMGIFFGFSALLFTFPVYFIKKLL